MGSQHPNPFFQRGGHRADGSACLGHVKDGRPGVDPCGRVIVLGVDDLNGQVQCLFQIRRLGFQGLTRWAGGVHLVQEQQAGDAQFADLKHQKKLALQRSGIGHKHHHIRTVRVVDIEQDALGHMAVFRLGVQVVQPGKVLHRPRGGSRPFARCRGGLHGDPRQVAYRHRLAGQSLEQGRFPRVGVSDEGELHACNLGREEAIDNPLNVPLWFIEVLAICVDRQVVVRRRPLSKLQSAGRCWC